jgi:putative FmdB family regulatory protein
MPIYEYRCPEGHQFDHFFRKISDAQATMPCPVCGKPATRIVSGGAGLVFKGSGFYITDYGKDGKKDRERATPKPAESTGSKEATASDTAGDSGGSSKKSGTPSSDSSGTPTGSQPPPAAKPTSGSSSSGSAE